MNGYRSWRPTTRQVGTVRVRAHDDDVVYVTVERNMNKWLLPWTSTLVGRTVSGWPYTIDERACWSEESAIRAGSHMLARERATFRRQIRPRRVTSEETIYGTVIPRRTTPVQPRDHQDGQAVRRKPTS